MPWMRELKKPRILVDFSGKNEPATGIVRHAFGMYAARRVFLEPIAPPAVNDISPRTIDRHEAL
jgi:hypothetical protein